MPVRRDDIIAAPLIGGVVGVFAFFMLYNLAGLGSFSGSVAGFSMGLLVSLLFAAAAGAIVFGELLAQALENKEVSSKKIKNDKGLQGS